TSDHDVVHRIDARYAVAVHPFIEGDHGPAPKLLAQEDRQELLLILPRLHSVALDHTPRARPVIPSVPFRADLERALEQLEEEWRGGPYSEQARSLLVIHSAHVREMLDTLDRLRIAV